MRENLEMGAYHRDDNEGIAQDMANAYQLFPRLGERKTQLAGTMSGGRTADAGDGACDDVPPQSAAAG